MWKMAIDGRTHYEGCWAERGHHDCAERRIAALEAQLTRIKEWCNAYPLEQFPEPDMQRFLIALGPQLLSELSAHNYRHVLNGIKAIIEGVSTGDAGTDKREGNARQPAAEWLRRETL
jgi:hypothetical protein